MSDSPEDSEWTSLHSLGSREGRATDESEEGPSWLKPLLTRDDGSRVDESDDDYEYWRLEELEYDAFLEMLEADRELIGLLKSHQWEEVYLKEIGAQSADEQPQVSQQLPPADVRRFLSPLSVDEKEFLKILYGLDVGTPRTVDETAELYDITPELVVQIEKNALKKLRCATQLPLPTIDAQQMPRVDSTSPNVSQVIDLLERLSLLSSAGHITREEFETLKARVIQEYK